MDWSLITTLLIIFLVTLVGGYVRSRSKDPCLEAFDSYPVTVERANGKVIWGTMHLWPTGMELIYTDNVQDQEHIESSYLLYAAEYPDIQTVYRYADKLTPEKRARRSLDIERSFHPNRWRRGWRGVRNFMGTASTSLTEAFSVLVGRMRKPVGAYISDKGEAYLTKLGGSLIGQAGSVYDEMLERHIGQKVVIEVIEGEQVHEHVGIFKNYSADFVEVLDVHYPPQAISDFVRGLRERKRGAHCALGRARRQDRKPGRGAAAGRRHLLGGSGAPYQRRDRRRRNHRSLP